MKYFMTVLLVLAMMLTLAPAAVWAEGYEVVKPGAELGAFFDPQWSGTKLFGPLSILYEFVAAATTDPFTGATVPTPGGCVSFEMNMVFVLKLKKGNNNYAFGDRRDSIAGAGICFENPNGQVDALVEFFKNTVILALFPGNPNAANNSRLKSVSNYTVSDINPAPTAGDTVMVTTRDVELAVKE